jgi:PPP family 3-phenylpropionic acid transporter
MNEAKGAGLVPLSGFYILYFGALGITLPFFPAYLKSLSLSASEIGVLLALPPLFSLFAPPFWGHLADWSGRGDRVLSLVSLGACACFALLLAANRFGSLFLVIGAYALFNSSITPLIDSLTLQRVALSGGSFARVRLFGSIGFVLSSSLFGISVAKIDRATVVVPLCLMAGYFAWSLGIRARCASASPPSPLSGLRLLADRDLAIVLAASCLHWIACAPFHGTFSIHVQALGLPPIVVGLAAGLGVLAETAFMYFYPRFANRIAAKYLLFVAFIASSARWTGMALVDRPELIILLSLLHGLTFGAFYVASVAYVSSRAAPQLRASAQALFVSATFGIGGLIGYLSSGVGYDALGGHRLFAAAGLVELLPAWLILRLRSAHPRVESPGPLPASSEAL